MQKNEELITSAFSRLLKLGGLAGRVGMSVAGNAVTSAFHSRAFKQQKKLENRIQNALRVSETFGNLKGIPMKIGQMLSLHEGFLPPEVTAILSRLQQKSPPISFYEIEKMIKRELGSDFQEIKYIDPNPYAAASIGQVHRAELWDGSQIVLKVQYPGIDKIIAADMKNLKGFLLFLFSMFTSMDLTLVWEELNERLLEELDYRIEAQNMKKMANFYQNSTSEIVMPNLVEPLCSKHVLCMGLLEGIQPDHACSPLYSQALRNKWGEVIFKFIVSGIFEHQCIHADPNLANFAFLEDGRLIVYDYGCIKTLPSGLAESYTILVNAVLTKEYNAIPLFLQKMGVKKASGENVSLEMVKDFAAVFEEPFREVNTPYTFGKDTHIYDRFLELTTQYWQDSMTLTFPQDIVFIDRTLVGHFGNLRKLMATACWREILEQYVVAALERLALSQNRDVMRGMLHK